MNIDWKTAPSFIESQFPVSKLSKESYKERKANYSQTLTGLGKWWGRKPLILVRATILGVLLPSTSDPRRDREVFLALLTMDEDGLATRRTKQMPLSVIFRTMRAPERAKWFEAGTPADRPKLRRGTSREEREQLQNLAFAQMTYDEKLEYCERPENVSGPSLGRWAFINAHLGTSAQSLPELVGELGKRRFGHIPRVGDAFSGGGSIPFEAARIGCDSYGSDLNPVAALLTWSALNLIGGGASTAECIKEGQRKVFDAVDAQLTEWGIEHNSEGWRADAFLYCVEVTCPECRWIIPVAPSWVIGEKTMTVAVLRPDSALRRFRIDVESGVDAARVHAAKKVYPTLKDSKLVCPHCEQTTPMGMLRGDRRSGGTTVAGLRAWENDDLVPRPEDVFQERLYCVRWVETFLDGEGIERQRKHYRGVDEGDQRRDEETLRLLRERFSTWQDKGYIPSWRIEPGAETNRLLRERGWTCWHHLFTPRQLLVHGLFQERTQALLSSTVDLVASALSTARLADWDSKLCRWDSSAANEKVAQTFSNQALNTLQAHAGKGLLALESSWFLKFDGEELPGNSVVEPLDARRVTEFADLWITDPPYADAVVYHELSEFLACWYAKRLPTLFPGWYSDTKRALAVTGSDDSFKSSMVSCYRNLAAHMNPGGTQVVMFTHQDASVWADLAVILWAAGLAVVSAWCLVTETDTALKEGHYVQGTVLLVLRKQTSDETAFLDEIHPQVEDEVRAQLASMLALEDKEDPNFGDADYQLAAYAAALRVLTRYRGIEDINVEDQLTRVRQAGEKNPVEELIADAVRTACDFLIPKGFNGDLWKQLGPEERLYLKAVEVETHGEHRSGVYQELARGFRVKDYKGLIESSKANHTRIKTATEFGARDLGTAGFGSSVMRTALFAVRETVRASDPQVGKNYLREALTDYWTKRVLIIALLDYLSNLGVTLEHWAADAEAARLLAGAVRNDSV